ncbi:urease accessory protein UreD [Nitrosovibrio sp. Nv17]|uniref:urease accessory protein UreD n=1 Tax=Nitrosovibrio sp. Nv17 TaxID=1855339 RepID=UPI000909151E|nr:urease accessory protein UreD [Nitrosovibrio sp. Nv17]SFW15946.1 urease accessory protein [Nitrosovibrio sp. Nv17]
MQPTTQQGSPANPNGRDLASSARRLYPVSSQPSPQVAAGLPQAPLQARLSLGFEADGGTTRLIERCHFGPLIVQKPLYPEGRKVCHVVVIHPPGGVVGGDDLEISAKAGPAAQVQLTTPGATKWYRANGHVSRQHVRLEVAAGAALEWVPQETIFFDDVNVALDQEVLLEKDASYIGCEILCFGRTASGESFTKGQIAQRIGIRRDGRLIWLERLRLAGGSFAMGSPLVLAGNTVCATLLAVGRPAPAEVLEAAREAAGALAQGTGQVGISQLKSVVVARYLGNSSETARRIMLHVWGLLRPGMLDRGAIVPRMWNT